MTAFADHEEALHARRADLLATGYAADEAERAAREYADVLFPRPEPLRVNGRRHGADRAGPGPQSDADDRQPDADARPCWPDPMDEEAMHGIAGEFVRMVEGDTEADRAAILIQFLVAFGVLVGRYAYYLVEATKHFANLYAVLVGATAKGRKGTSWSRVLAPFERIVDWKPHVSGLSSGEGIEIQRARRQRGIEKEQERRDGDGDHRPRRGR
jgi:hypothetical protein